MSDNPDKVADPFLQPHHIDRREMPTWGFGPDGRATPIGDDPRLPSLFRDWAADACRHPRAYVIARSDSAGRDFYSRYCRDCGHQLRSHVPFDEAKTLADLTTDDFREISARYAEDRTAQLDRITSAAAERMQPINRASYDDYLRSDAWRSLRNKIIKRASGTCEGCLTERATEVHHLSRDHMGNEFAFELLALCRQCHERIEGFHRAA